MGLLVALLAFAAGDAAGVGADLLGPIRRRGKPARVAQVFRLVLGDASAAQLGAPRSKPQTPQGVVELPPCGVALRPLLRPPPASSLPSGR